MFLIVPLTTLMRAKKGKITGANPSWACLGFLWANPQCAGAQKTLCVQAKSHELNPWSIVTPEVNTINACV